jgi:hypothetical protein
MSCSDDTLTQECPTLPKLANYAKGDAKFLQAGVQKEERSGEDSTQFKKGIVQYSYVKSNQTKQFASHADYLVWKRMNAQLHFLGRSVANKVVP